MLNLFFSLSVKSVVQHRVQVIAQRVFNETNQVLRFQRDIDVYIARENDNNHLRSTQLSIGAESFASGVMFLQLSRADFDELELTRLLFHELNHLKRFEKFSVELDSSLLNWIVFEGLAVTFEEQMADRYHYSFPECTTISLNDISRQKYLIGLKQVLTIDKHNSPWDYEQWFFNFDDSDKDKPQNFGYKIGKILVNEYFKDRNISPDQAVMVNTEELRIWARERVGGDKCAK